MNTLITASPWQNETGPYMEVRYKFTQAYTLPAISLSNVWINGLIGSAYCSVTRPAIHFNAGDIISGRLRPGGSGGLLQILLPVNTDCPNTTTYAAHIPMSVLESIPTSVSAVLRKKSLSMPSKW
jgi:hypothetical protein